MVGLKNVAVNLNTTVVKFVQQVVQKIQLYFLSQSKNLKMATILAKKKHDAITDQLDLFYFQGKSNWSLII